MKKFKMRTVIIAIVSTSTAVGIILLCALASVNTNNMLREKINENMATYLDAQANSVNEFVKNSEQVIKLYSQNDAIRRLIKEDLADAENDPERTLPEYTDEYNTAAYFLDNYPSYPEAQQYTLDYYGTLDNWEGIYVGNFETRVLAYSVPPVIGKVLRTDPDKVAQLMDSMKSNPDGVYNAGIIVSPGTGQLCLSMYCPVYEDGEMIGYVGGGVFHTELEKLLKSFQLKGSTQSNFYMLNTKTGVTFTDTEASESEQANVIAKETTRPVLKEVISKASTGSKGQFEYKDGKKNLIVNYEMIPGYDWVLVITADKNELYSVSRYNLLNMVVLGIITFALITVLVTILAIRLSGSLVKTVAELDKAANGDISSDARIDSNVVEIDSIGRSLSSLKKKLRDVILKTQDMSKELNVAGSDLAGSADRASSTSSNVTGAVAEVSKGAASQAESIQTAAQCTDSMGNNIDDISANITALDEATGSMRDNCDKVVSTLREVFEQSSAVSNAISEIGKTIDATDRSAEEIVKFSETINSIASQTNLLSLNASIEAARAGEAGRGFSVVADEIRILANQSRSSSDEIKLIVDRLMEDAKASVKTMETLTESFRMQGEQISLAQKDIEEMAENMSVVSDRSGSISEMVRNLENAKESLTDVVENLSAISEENAASTEQTSISMNELDSTFEVINESATQLRALAADLTETISYFK